VGFYTDANPEDMVIIKVFGLHTDVMIDRKAEIETMRVRKVKRSLLHRLLLKLFAYSSVNFVCTQLLHERKCGAELYATFDNGICYEYVNGSTLEINDCADPNIYPLVAAEMAHMHTGMMMMGNGSAGDSSHNANSGDHNMNGNGQSHNHDDESEESQEECPLWSKLVQLGKLAEECMENDDELRRNLELPRTWTSSAVAELRNLLEPKKMPITFCHNDLIPRNIVYDKKRKRVTFIDVEYAMPNYSAFDVANHFLEFAGIIEFFL